MILVVDVGTTSVRVAVADESGQLIHFDQRRLAPTSPFPGLVEFDPVAMAVTVVDMARDAVSSVGSVGAVGVTTQRASTIVWDRSTGEPLGPGLGWQDLRTVGECLTVRAEHAVAVAPNQTATKAAWLLSSVEGALDRDLCVGTVDSWVVWALSGGSAHVTDHTEAAVTGLYSARTGTWDDRLCGIFGVPRSALPSIVDSVGVAAMAAALPGAPPITAIVGDQQASLVGQGCVRPGMAKVTFGTGGMLDVCTGDDDALAGRGGRSDHGCFGIVAWSRDGRRTFGAEAIMLAAGTNVEWLSEDLGLIDSPAHSHDVAATCSDTGGVVFVPAPLGLGTPHWDYGSRSMLIGATRGTGRAEVVRAVLAGVAHRGVAEGEAAEADTGLAIGAVRVDGGMSRNPTFVQLLADAAGRPVEVAAHAEATTVGAADLARAGLTGAEVADIAGTRRPATVVDPVGQPDRERWHLAVERSRRWIPELSALDF
ncbi:MAG: FGGY family carbohydrate kinase [Ilumatobacteraceae bacterium]